MPDNRPTSPHLTIYRWQISSVLSILHRLTGVALFFGTVLIVAWLWSVAYAPSFYAILYGWLASIPGRMLLLGWMAAFYYHLGNGIRHLFWDIGWGFTIPQFTRSGWLVILFTLIMTAATWGFINSSAIQVP
jgi:succinate dehydrogenase / fumarate reductase, cytochrome b subunit